MVTPVCEPNTSISPIPPRVTLTSLPSELLILVGHSIAPHGGRSISSLRLTSKHFSKPLLPILFSRIHITRDPLESDTLFAELAWDLNGWKQHVRDVRWDVPTGPSHLHAHQIATLPNIRSLMLKGEAPPFPDRDQLLVQEPIPQSIMDALPRMSKQFTTLQIENLEIVERRGIHQWAPTVRELVITESLGSSRPFFGQTSLRKATLHLTPREAKLIQSFRALAFLEGALPTVEEVELRWCKINSRDHNSEPLYDLDPTIFPLKSFRLLGTPHLFTSSPPTGVATQVFLDLFNFIGQSGIEELSIPLRQTFIYDPIWSNLSFPNLRKLELACETAPDPDDIYDVFTAETYHSLISFLSSFPSLTSLHLVGWLDETGLALGFLSHSELARDFVLVIGLLAFLRDSQMLEVRFSLSKKHPEITLMAGETCECVFERKSRRDEWVGRLARFW
ncbi:hypothetical protein P7C70_g654, partial [Phenoliferia sp. Uapishka_3]